MFFEIQYMNYKSCIEIYKKKLIGFQKLTKPTLKPHVFDLNSKFVLVLHFFLHTIMKKIDVKLCKSLS